MIKKMVLVILLVSSIIFSFVACSDKTAAKEESRDEIDSVKTLDDIFEIRHYVQSPSNGNEFVGINGEKISLDDLGNGDFKVTYKNLDKKDKSFKLKSSDNGLSINHNDSLFTYKESMIKRLLKSIPDGLGTVVKTEGVFERAATYQDFLPAEVTAHLKAFWAKRNIEYIVNKDALGLHEDRVFLDIDKMMKDSPAKIHHDGKDSVITVTDHGDPKQLVISQYKILEEDFCFVLKDEDDIFYAGISAQSVSKLYADLNSGVDRDDVTEDDDTNIDPIDFIVLKFCGKLCFVSRADADQITKNAVNGIFG